MGLFDIFKKKPGTDAPSAPEPVGAHYWVGAPCAPVNGKLIEMTQVPDPVFSNEMLGKGCAIWPDGDVVYAPVSGAVTVTMGHAVGITSDDGIEALVHVGIDTVNLGGKGFTSYVSQGEKVTAGQPVLKMDRSVIASAGYRDCVVLAISNSAEFEAIELAAESGTTVEAGAPVIKLTRAQARPTIG